MGFVASDIIPVGIGTKWEYVFCSSFYNTNIKLKVIDYSNNRYKVVASGAGMEGIAFLMCDEDLYITGYGKLPMSIQKSNNIANAKKILILKNPVIKGASWSNDFGIFKVIDTEYKFKIKDKVFKDCIVLRFVDSSGRASDFYIKEGIGILYCSLYIDAIGRASLTLKSFESP